MKKIKIISLVLLIMFVVIQFIPTSRNQSNIIPKSDFIVVNNLPNEIQSKFQISCYDCHSNNTNYPWYNKVQPIAWFLENHIKEGKSELNFSEWENYSNRRKKSKLKSIINRIKNNEMPLPSYTLIHNEAVLKQSEKTLIIDFLNSINDSLN